MFAPEVHDQRRYGICLVKNVLLFGIYQCRITLAIIKRQVMKFTSTTDVRKRATMSASLCVPTFAPKLFAHKVQSLFFVFIVDKLLP